VIDSWYLSPESYDCISLEASDVFTLGSIFVETLARHAAFPKAIRHNEIAFIVAVERAPAGSRFCVSVRLSSD
jgi:hypothetical protein